MRLIWNSARGIYRGFVSEKLSSCELEKLHGLRRRYMQPNANGFGLMIACCLVGYLMKIQSESFTLVQNNAKHDMPLHPVAHSSLWFLQPTQQGVGGT